MLNENLSRVRKERGLTQEALAIKLNVVRQTVSKWEKGTAVPDADTLCRIADALDVSIALHVDITDSELEVTNFEWYRWGDHEQHGLEEFGLYWDKNRNAVIVPTDGTGLFTGFTKEEWDAVTTKSQKIAFMLNAIDSPQHTASEYTGISTNGSGPVRDVILTITADGCINHEFTYALNTVNFFNY